MDAATFLDRYPRSARRLASLCHVQVLPPRGAEHADVPGGLAEPVRDALRRAGIERLYTHQAEAVARVRAGEDVVVVTGTASGKTLCYQVPIAESILEDPLSTALCLYPTKALTQDQLRGMLALHDPQAGLRHLAGAYDGDTPQNLRRRLRDSANVLMTNPDMLHQGILPQHARWNRFFTHLRYVVIDEVHAYRGVFGSHLANVVRRLDRICRHYGSNPRFLCSSATIGNPRHHAERIVGRPMTLIDRDGAPRGPKRFVLWNPPAIEGAAAGDPADWRVGGDRRSALWEAVELMTALVREGVQTIAFVRTRLAAEMLFRHCREKLRPVSRRLAESVHAYRGGYLAEERREIERRLVSREIMGIASTNALELGIDIGSLEACILVGYPGSIASTWQQAGRAGRGGEEALVFYVAQNAPIDQFLVAHSDYLFAQSPEAAVVDPDNPHVVIGHVRCAAHELPVREEEAGRFGAYGRSLLEMLEEEGDLHERDGRWYWARTEYPAAEVNLRNIAGPVYTIQDDTAQQRVIGTMDEVSALTQLHTHAVYLHGAETYLVARLDLESKIAHVERQDLDYYTRSVQVSQIRLDEVAEQAACRGAAVGYGDVTVTTSIPMFRKIKFHSRDSLGFEALELPPQTLETVAMWICPPLDSSKALLDAGMQPAEALLGIANVLLDVAPLFVMCDPSDIGATVDSACLGREAVFVFDRYPGGMGFARRCLDCIDELLLAVQAVVDGCPCKDGCPSCVGSAVPAFAMTDMDSAVRGRIPDKEAARALLREVLGSPEPPSA
ncbi:MAG TPA: DEAD/DEAH box helicase [Chthonomonadales bacterium]|nr:DEAD/DEAH box helicase [Chthonomonadales bacterium]